MNKKQLELIQQNISDIERTHTHKEQSMNQFFGRHLILTHPVSQHKVLCLTKNYTDQQQIAEDVQKIQNYKSNRNFFLIELLDFSITKKKKMLCSRYYQLKLFFEYPGKSLLQLQRHNTETHGFMSSQDITYLLYHQVFANTSLQKKGIYHGNISEQSIFHNSQNEFKLGFNFFDNTNNYAKQSLVNKVYKSPIEHLALYKNIPRSKIVQDNYKSDAWSLGMVLLQMGVSENVQNIYNLNGTIDIVKLQQLKQQFFQRYLQQGNRLVVTAVDQLTQIEEKDRLDMMGLYELLPEFQDILEYFYQVQNGINQEGIQTPLELSKAPMKEMILKHDDDQLDVHQYIENYEQDFTQDRNLSKEFEKIRVEQHEGIYRDGEVPMKEKIIVHENNPKVYQNIENHDVDFMNENDINRITPQKQILYESNFMEGQYKYTDPKNKTYMALGDPVDIHQHNYKYGTHYDEIIKHDENQNLNLQDDQLSKLFLIDGKYHKVQTQKIQEKDAQNNIIIKEVKKYVPLTQQQLQQYQFKEQLKFIS